MNRYRFEDIFQVNPNGSLTPRRPIGVNGMDLYENLGSALE